MTTKVLSLTAERLRRAGVPRLRLAAGRLSPATGPADAAVELQLEALRRRLDQWDLLRAKLDAPWSGGVP